MSTAFFCCFDIHISKNYYVTHSKPYATNSYFPLSNCPNLTYLISDCCPMFSMLNVSAFNMLTESSAHFSTFRFSHKLHLTIPQNTRYFQDRRKPTKD